MKHCLERSEACSPKCVVSLILQICLSRFSSIIMYVHVGHECWGFVLNLRWKGIWFELSDADVGVKMAPGCTSLPSSRISLPVCQPSGSRQTRCLLPTRLFQNFSRPCLGTRFKVASGEDLLLSLFRFCFVLADGRFESRKKGFKGGFSGGWLFYW